ncbi:MAG: TRAP transporter large permease subunit [Deltaproteobacteria bacterium]
MEYLALWMFFALTVLLFTGFPVAFTLLGTSLAFGLAGFGWAFFNLLPLRIWGIMSNFTLVAVPLFIFMGLMLEKSGIARDLLETMGKLLGRIRGGLVVSVILVGAVLGASTGIVGATVVTLGLIALPTLIKWGYDHRLSTGAITAAGTLGQIIPPSIVLVLLGDIVGVSIGDLFIGAVMPGLLLVLLYLIYVIVRIRLFPAEAGTVPMQDEKMREGSPIGRIVWGFLAPVVLILAVLGSIFAGVASPTEAAGIGASVSAILCIARRRLTIQVLREVMEATTQLTSMVFVILVGAAAFGLVFRGLGGDTVIRNLLLHIPFGKWGVLTTVMALVFVLGFFLDFIEITFIHIPVLAPIMASLGFDPLWFSILFAMNLQTSFLTPPFGFALFYLKGVAPPGVTTEEIYRGVVPFVLMQLAALAIVAAFPWIATWLPSVLAR